MAVWNKVLKKLKSGTWYPLYNTFYEREKVNPREILLESRSGKALESNIFAICQELNKPEYGSFKKVLAVHRNSREAVEKKLRHYGVSVDKFINVGSLSYYFHLSTAGYLVNDTTFPGRFIKKENQVYLNLWHGTPLKRMGRDNEGERYSMGNVMRNLLMADYLVFPNRYMEEKMSGAYMLSELYRGTILREGYPRNCIFFDEKKGRTLKEKMGYGSCQLSIYMPTFRGKADRVDYDEALAVTKEHLNTLDHLLKENQVLLVKLHPFVERFLDIEGYNHIRPFPRDYDTYDVLNACDVLITDYSSVMYDFANTGRRIILFAYDSGEYHGQRGMYEDILEYPFDLARTPEEVATSLNLSASGVNRAFLNKYCTYEGADATEKICRHVFLKQPVCRTYKPESNRNGKKNVLIYAGDLDQNGITTAFCSMMARLDRKKYNYYISFRKISLERAPERLERIPSDVGIYPIASEMNLDVITAIAQMCYLRWGITSLGVGGRLCRAYTREWTKHFGSVKFDHVVHYNGYENYMIALLRMAPCSKTIWVHNDMEKETAVKKNPSRALLHDAYRGYDHVIIVGEDIRNTTFGISKRADNIDVIQNCHDYESVLRRAQEPLSFDENTQSTVSRERLQEILQGPERKFINIGRYSHEKGHGRLIRAFNRFWKEHQDFYLIIIGGTGTLYERTCALAEEMEAAEHIILIKSMRNPMPVLKSCDLFLLSSLYEGLGLVLLEADVLGIPVMACDVNGPRDFLKKHGGVLLEDSEDGLLQGMKMYLEREIPAMDVDYEALNRESIAQCEALFGE